MEHTSVNDTSVGQPLEFGAFQSVSRNGRVTDKTFTHRALIDIGAKGLVFENCNFSFCVFTRAYFRSAQFVGCKFVGSHFYDCNFRGATLSRCSFEYAAFRGTLISPQEVLANLPEWPNVSRELLRSHKANAQSVGDTDAVKLFVREEIAAEREHYRRARERKQSYYKEKYPGWSNWIKIRLISFWFWLGWFTWGHGEYPWRLVRFTFVGLPVLSLAVFLQTVDFSSMQTIQQLSSGLLEAVAYTISLFLGLHPDGSLAVHGGIGALTVIFRYIMLGLFINALFYRFSRR